MLYLLLLIFSLTSIAADLPKTLPNDPLNSTKEIEEKEKREAKQEKLSQEKTEQKLEKNIIGKVDKWTALRANPNRNNVCYAILYADERKGNETLAKEKPYIMVHYFAEGRMRFSAYFGYSLLEYRDVHLSVDATQHKLKSMNEYAVTEVSDEDERIITSMKNASNLMIRGEGANYSYSIDFYDISGFAEIFKVLQSNCDSTTNNSSFKGVVPTKKNIKKV